jgi:S1-C subfamily serine protease
MHRFLWIAGMGLLLQACSMAPAPDPKIPGADVRRMVMARAAAVLVTESPFIGRWAKRNFTSGHSPDEADGGSAAPVADDGYFLTADHVLAREKGRNIFVLVGNGGRLSPHQARVVWRSPKADLALLHVELATPDFYHWSPKDRWLSAGTPVVHGGLATGGKSGWGRLGSSVPPEKDFSGYRTFRIDIPLQPGDSGGAVVDAYGRLIGINSAVEFLVPMETAFFIDSEGKRPHLGELERVIAEDRIRRDPEQGRANKGS